MSMPVLEKDDHLIFPHSIIVKASAGSGKTHALTKRFVQFLVSGRIGHNRLRNILAITFSNNAAREMRERILSWLKDIYFGDEDRINELLEIVSVDRGRLIKRAEVLIEEILSNYTDFQVRTIDSFMASVFKASALDLGYSPDFEILLSADNLIEYVFNLFLREVKEGTPQARFLEDITGIMQEGALRESSYLWDPSKRLLDEIRELYRKLSSLSEGVNIKDRKTDMDKSKAKIRIIAEGLEMKIKESGLQRSKKCLFPDLLKSIRKNLFSEIIGMGLKSNPVLKDEKTPMYFEILDIWNNLIAAIDEFSALYSQDYYQPYLRVFEVFKGLIEAAKRQEGVIFIEDLNKKISTYLDYKTVPDIYFRIGDTVYHYLIDEFQDTSPIQWKNLRPLIENSLSQGGSLFAVGDTKQAIYRFRDADYRIMKQMESERPFLSAEHYVRELNVNYRSLREITDFSKRIFQGVLSKDDKYREAAAGSGLASYDQSVKEGSEAPGYAEITLWDKDDEGRAERRKILDIVTGLKKKGYRYSDMTILTLRNEDVVNVATWLNEAGIPFISFSSLDVRMRKLTGELVSLLNFLDSPPDDLSFGAFLIGDMFGRMLGRHNRAADRRLLHEFLFENRGNPPLYKAFEQRFPELWGTYIERLFKSAGYLPLYDLASEIIKVFEVFETFRHEEATIVKILEVIKDFEGSGKNNLRDFLRYAVDEESNNSEWNIDVPQGMETVKVMTVHKAKGLGFPVVIVLLYGQKKRGFKYIVMEDPEGVNLLKLNKNLSRAGQSFEEAYRKEELKELINKLNTLYVGFTRAESELYVVGVRGEQKQFPFDFLPVDEFLPGVNSTPVRSRPAEHSPVQSLYHHHGQVIFPASAGGMLNMEEKRRGDFIHRVLCFIEYAGAEIQREMEDIIMRVNDETGAHYPVKELSRALLDFLSDEKIKVYFLPLPGRSIKREQFFSDSRGDLNRMDRVVLDASVATVIDFKTGTDRKGEDKYVAQLRNYMGILRDIYPDRKVEGLIAYTDLKAVREIV